MGGRGTSGATRGATKRQLTATEKHIKGENWFKDAIKYTPKREKLLESPSFVSAVEDAIGKYVFFNDINITEKQQKKLAKKLIRGD